MPSALDILKQYWGHQAFRPIQEEIINAVIDGHDTLALLPTGGGKSICFQIPALSTEGICLVISPLIALMKDQVENLTKRGITALCIHSGLNYFEVTQTLQNAAYGNFKFLYVSPERLESDLFKAYLPELNINLIAVDEAHCISQWGYDFRPPYLRIAALRNELPKVPMLALTASATPSVQADICANLSFKSSKIFKQPFDRPNLSFSAFKVDSKVNKLIEILSTVPGTSIVYCRNRKLTKETAQLLQLNNISADYYHAGLSQQDRNAKQESWIQNKVRVIVCTNAFGMGIDKPDVRSVIHYDVPDNLENYYQEAGRGGRDGLRSFAVLLYNEREIQALYKQPDLKYPDVAIIRNIYQAIANYLQLPIGSGEGLYYDFNLLEFVKQFKLDSVQVINALKALEQDGHLSFNEQVFIAAKIGFVCSRDVLESFQQSHPQFDVITKYLLRSLEGVFDNLVSFNETLLCQLIKTSKQEMQQQLHQLKAFNIIDYQPQKETPQLYFRQNRAPAQHLTFNETDHKKRREAYRTRIAAMLDYVHLNDNCRSVFIGNYFGDTDIKKCHSCDNCLHQKNLLISADEFSLIKDKIMQQLHSKSINVKDLIGSIPGFKKDKLWKVVSYLQTERKLLLNDDGMISAI